MKPASCKAKGRQLQNHVAEEIRTTFGLPPEDVRPAVMGETGCDIKLSHGARQRVPFAIECKKRETLNIWEALKQAEANAKAEGLKPALVFSRNRSAIYATVRFEDLLALIARETP